MAKPCTKFIVSGIVQGVGFRYHTCHQGLKLGLTGYARNLANGDVEVVAYGPEENIEELYLWLQIGPRSARVDSVEKGVCMSDRIYRGFEIL